MDEDPAPITRAAYVVAAVFFLLLLLVTFLLSWFGVASDTLRLLTGLLRFFAH
jgi:small neutral amino acid transporter SnatA (MarC family)